ncbi:MAG: hypothetical protein LBI87_15315 [Candidatus Accumulibacter sp.]|nr:hypothetical protein [Accumulibacter sp.]
MFGKPQHQKNRAAPCALIRAASRIASLQSFFETIAKRHLPLLSLAQGSPIGIWATKSG